VRKLWPTVRPGAGPARAARRPRRAAARDPRGPGEHRDHGPWTACDVRGRRRSASRTWFSVVARAGPDVAGYSRYTDGWREPVTGTRWPRRRAAALRPRGDRIFYL